MGKKGKRLYAGVDLGGTSLLAVVTSGKGKVLGAREEATEVKRGDARPVIEQVVRAVRKAADKAGVEVKQISALGIGAAGAVDPDKGIVHTAPNLGWDDVPLSKELEGALGVESFVDNDVHVAMIGEYEKGAARGARHAIAIWVGTGIGGAVIVRGRLHYGCRGSAGEIGHTVIQIDGPPCKCGRKGCVEALASRTAMERQVREEAKNGKKSAALKIMDEEGKTRMTSSVIAKALEARDPVMREVYERAQHALGMLTANLVNVMDPEVVVIGGGIAERFGDDFVAPIRKTAYENFLQKDGREKIKIVPCALGERAGAIGAALMARSRL